jgi:hypothetical protein
MAENQDEISAFEIEEDDIEPPKKKCKTYKQTYNSLWEKDPKLKGWLAPVRKSPYKAYCKICEKELTAGLSELKKHETSNHHQDKQKAVKNTRSIADMVVTDTVQEQVKIAEIKLATFVAEHNLPFAVMDHLSDLVKELFPDSTIASKIKCKHTKTRCIVKNVLARRFKTSVIETLQKTKFSIIIDETTDIATKKQLALIVRYYSEQDLTVKSHFLCLIKLIQSDATTLTTALVREKQHSFDEHNWIDV